MDRAIFVSFDNLHRSYGALATADPKKDLIILIESQRMLASRKWHIQRLWFMISAARHFANELEGSGFKVIYKKANSTVEGIKEVISEHAIKEVLATEPNSYRLRRELESGLKESITFVENDFFLTPRALFEEWAGSQKTYVMENFYRQQRSRLNILMDKGKPTGGEWNFDKENRLPPPKNYKLPVYKGFERDEIDRAVAKDLGIELTDVWATTRAGAQRQLKVFIKKNEILVEGVNMVKRHVKPGTASKEGGIVSFEKPIK